ncbi:hypothetical protein BC567DRAFT_83201 [Phyllosticta citribraziliensis]
MTIMRVCCADFDTDRKPCTHARSLPPIFVLPPAETPNYHVILCSSPHVRSLQLQTPKERHQSHYKRIVKGEKRGEPKKRKKADPKK